MQSTITSKGQATIPKEVRDHLHVGPGDKIKFFFHRDGSVAILPVQPITALRGIIPAPEKPVTLEEMEAAVQEGASERWGRHLRDQVEEQA